MADQIEERGLRAKIREYLESRQKSVTVKKVMRIIDGFPSIDAFCNAKSSEWLIKYRASRPNSSFDIGRKVKRAIEETIAFVREDRLNNELDRLAKEKEMKDLAEARAKAEREAEEEEEKRHPKFTLGELKSIVAFMELCDIKAIDLKKVRDFLSMIDANIKENDDRADHI